MSGGMFMWFMLVVLSVCDVGISQLSLLPPKRKPEPEVELDLGSLLETDVASSDRIDDGIWDLSSRPGRRLIQLPVVVTPLDQPSELGTPPLDLRGGRFVCWRIASEESEPVDSVFSETRDETVVIPRVSRDVVVLPSGVIRWPLERAIPGFDLKSGDDLYLLKLRPDRLQEDVPERPERLTKRTTESNREFRERQQESHDKYRDAMEAYRHLRDEIRDLPDVFESSLPGRLWAVFEMSDSNDEIELTGESPLPWSIDIELLELLGELKGQTGRSGFYGGGSGLTDDDVAKIEKVSVLLDDEHPYSWRLLSQVLTSGDRLSISKPGDQLEQVYLELVDSGDEETRNRIVAAAAGVIPPTKVSAKLLERCKDDLTGRLRLMWLRSLFHSELLSPAVLGEMITTANRELANVSGPDAGRIIEQLLLGISDKPEALELVAVSINFDTLPADRQGQVLRYIIASSADQPLAARWLNEKLLGSSDSETVIRTLRMIDEGQSGPQIIKPLANWMMSRVTAPSAESEGITNHDSADDVDQGWRSSATSDGGLNHLVSSISRGKIPLDSADHHLVELLTSSDDRIRPLAWQVLPRFQVSTGTPSLTFSRQTMQSTEDQTQNIFHVILEAAYSQGDLPPQVISFLDNHPDSLDATSAMVDIAIKYGTYHGDRACRLLIGSGRELSPAVESLTGEHRYTFAGRVYSSLYMPPPAAAGLLSESGTQTETVRWFADRVSSGAIPGPNDWAESFGSDESRLLGLLADKDNQAATGALAVLITKEGGDSGRASELIKRFDRSEPAVSSRSMIKQTWSEIRRELRTASLSSAAGTYMLTVVLRGEVASGPAEPGSPSATGSDTAEVKVPLGVIDLIADGTNLYVSGHTFTITVADDKYAIRIGQVIELKNFNNEKLADVPLVDITQPLDLLPEEHNTWRGKCVFSGMVQGELEMVMEPL